MTELAHRHPQVFGVLITTLGVMFFVPDALIVRIVGLDVMATAFWRGLFACLVTLAAIAALAPWAWTGWRRLMRPASLLMILWQGLGSVLFIGALGQTSVANVMVISATVPFIAALLSWAVLRESPSRATWAAMAAVFAGVAVIGWGSLGGGTWRGDLMALACAGVNAAYYVTVRKAPDEPFFVQIALGYLLTAVITYPLAPGLALEGGQLGLMLLSGCVILAGGGGLLVLAPRYLPAPEVTMFTLLEIVLSPVLVWAVIGEVPARATLIGAPIILGAILFHAAWNLREVFPARG